MPRMEPNKGARRKSVTKSISLPADLWEQIIDCQFEGRLISQAETIRRVVVAGLAVLKKKRGGKEGLETHADDR